MDPEVIKKKAQELPVEIQPRASKESDNKGEWTGEDGGAEFRFNRQPLLPEGETKIHWLEVKGDAEARRRLIDDFKKALGEPDGRRQDLNQDNVERAAWIIDDSEDQPVK